MSWVGLMCVTGAHAPIQPLKFKNFHTLPFFIVFLPNETLHPSYKSQPSISCLLAHTHCPRPWLQLVAFASLINFFVSSEGNLSDSRIKLLNCVLIIQAHT